MIAAHIENLLFLLLIAVALLFQLLARAASKASRGQTEETSPPVSPTVSPIPRAEPETDQERIRKFLEALGQPATSNPPSRVAPRTDIPPRPLAPVKPPTSRLPPLWKPIREERREGDVIPSQPGAKRATATMFGVHERLSVAEQPAISKTRMEIYPATTQPAVQRKDLKSDIATLLASKSRLRDAIILREILGPPRGLQAKEIGT